MPPACTLHWIRNIALNPPVLNTFETRLVTLMKMLVIGFTLATFGNVRTCETLAVAELEVPRTTPNFPIAVLFTLNEPVVKCTLSLPLMLSKLTAVTPFPA